MTSIHKDHSLPSSCLQWPITTTPKQQPPPSPPQTNPPVFNIESYISYYFDLFGRLDSVTFRKPACLIYHSAHQFTPEKFMKQVGGGYYDTLVPSPRNVTWCPYPTDENVPQHLTHFSNITRATLKYWGNCRHHFSLTISQISCYHGWTKFFQNHSVKRTKPPMHKPGIKHRRFFLHAQQQCKSATLNRPRESLFLVGFRKQDP